MDGEDGPSFLRVRQGDKKDLIKAPLSQYLGREEFNHIGCGCNKDESAFLLHPGKEGGQDPRLSSTPSLLALNADACFDLIDPEHRGCNRLRGSKGDL